MSTKITGMDRSMSVARAGAPWFGATRAAGWWRLQPDWLHSRAATRAVPNAALTSLDAVALHTSGWRREASR
jgi:hypothetical protein